jgi:aminomethyltransferase
MAPDAASLPTDRPRLLLPGVRALPPGVERFVVAGGGSLTLPVFAGDRLEVIDREGRQACEIVAMTADGREAPGLIGAADDGPAEGLRAMLARGGGEVRGLLDALGRRGLPATFGHAARRFGGDSPAGAHAAFSVEGDGFLVIAAPGEAMEVGEHATLTPLEVFITRAHPSAAANAALPDPLAEPRYEFRIAAGTAHAYEVAEGEYIQIVDIEGRECSDFQAFNARQLQKGIERDIDPTATRTLMGAAYPLPGLHSKYWDNDLQPTLELIQDTVGRHDTFGFACTPKYYDDVGYPGHVNCTANFNAALEPFGVRPRGGWQAINFFYNTNIDAHNQLYLDDPWSRPGDHVLVRALSDMVAVSSACPDEISAANGWNPTDILVRVYRPENLFAKSIAFRAMPDSDPQMTKETGFHPRTSALTRKFVEYNGYWMAASYPKHGKVAEYWAAREGVIAMDLSALRKFEVTGPDAEELLQRTLTRNVRRLAVGQVVYSAMCYEHGGMIDDGTLLRMSDTNFRWVGGTDFGGQWLREKAAEWGLRAWVRNSTDQLNNLSVQGPKSRDVLKGIVWTPPAQPALEEVDWFRFTIGRIGDHNGVPVVVSRTGYTGELGYEVWCHPRHAPEVWDAVFEAGAPHGIVPLGLEALDMLRIEAGLVFAGQEFDDSTDPFEAGIGFTVPLKTKEDDFVGRAALEERKAHPRHKLVGLELAGGEAASHGDCVHVGRAQVGVVTSAMKSPLLGKNIALARLDVTHAGDGTQVEVGKLDGHQKRIPAVVVPFPFYDPGKERPRS